MFPASFISWEQRKLGDVGTVSMCKRIFKDETSDEGDIPFYKIGTFGDKADAFISNELFPLYKTKYSYPKKGDILISCSGTIGRIVEFDGRDSYFQDSNIVWIKNDETIILNPYLKYILQQNPFIASSGGTISRLYNKTIGKTVIKVPSIDRQKEIIKLLDNFDLLCNNKHGAIMLEINARQKQYDYYRDQLLTFYG